LEFVSGGSLLSYLSSHEGKIPVETLLNMFALLLILL